MFTIHERKSIEYYYNLDGELVEENDQIPSVYVVRCNLTGEKDFETWEDQADFDTLEEAKQYIKELKGEL